MMRRRAFCASFVIESASSRMISWYVDTQFYVNCKDCTGMEKRTKKNTFGRVCRIQLNFPDSIIFPYNHFKVWLKQRNEDVSETGTSNISSKKCCLVEIKYLPLPTPLYFCVYRILPSKQGTGKGCIRIKIAMKSGIRPFQNASDLKHCHKRIPMLNFFLNSINFASTDTV